MRADGPRRLLRPPSPLHPCEIGFPLRDSGSWNCERCPQLSGFGLSPRSTHTSARHVLESSGVGGSGREPGLIRAVGPPLMFETCVGRRCSVREECTALHARVQCRPRDDSRDRRAAPRLLTHVGPAQRPTTDRRNNGSGKNDAGVYPQYSQSISLRRVGCSPRYFGSRDSGDVSPRSSSRATHALAVRSASTPSPVRRGCSPTNREAKRETEHSALIAAVGVGAAPT